MHMTEKEHAFKAAHETQEVTGNRFPFEFERVPPSCQQPSQAAAGSSVCIQPRVWVGRLAKRSNSKRLEEQPVI